VPEVLYPSLSNTNEAWELDPKSFGFSKIILGLIPILEGFEEDHEESFLTEKEFREVIQNSLVKVEKYFTNEI
jgi:hypothetical protein